MSQLVTQSVSQSVSQSVTQSRLACIAFAISLALVVAACTSSTEAVSSDLSIPGQAGPTVSQAADGAVDPTSADPAAGDLVVADVVNNDARRSDGVLADSVPNQLVVAGGPGAILIDRSSGDEIVLVSPVPIAPGTNPAAAEHIIAAFDVGDGRILFETQNQTSTSISILRAGGAIERLATGSHVVVDDTRRWMAFVASEDTVVVSELDTGEVRSEVSVGGAVSSLAWTPSGNRLAIGWTDRVASSEVGDNVVSVVDVDEVGISSAPVATAKPRSVQWHHPTWLDDETLAVVEQVLVVSADTFSGFALEGVARLAVVDLTSNRVLSSTDLPTGVIAADASPDGEAIAIVGTDGIVRWWSAGGFGLLAVGAWTSATW